MNPSDHPGSVPKTTGTTTRKASTKPTASKAPATSPSPTDAQEATPLTTPKMTTTDARTILDNRTPEERVTSARQMVQQRTAEHAVTEAAVRDLDARLDDGDDSVTGAHLSEAANDARVSGALLASARKGLKTALAEADAQSAMDSPDVAEALAAIIKSNAMEFGLWGVDVVVVDRLYPGDDLSTITVPSIRLRQMNATEQSASGMMSGSVLVAYITDASSGSVEVSGSFAEFASDSDDVSAITRYSPGIAAHEFGNGVAMTIAGFTVKGIRPSIPVVTGRASQHEADTFGDSLARDIAWHCGAKREQGVKVGQSGIGGGDAASLKSNVTAHSVGARITGTTTEGRITRTTVEIDVIARASGAIKNGGGDLFTAMSHRAESYGPATSEQIGANILPARAGKFIGGALGRIETAKVLGAHPVEGGGRGLTAEFVMVSQRAA